MSTVEVLDNQAVIIGTNRAARLEPYIKDANARGAMFDFAPGDGSDVPVLYVGVNLAGQDLGMLDGLTQPMVATVDLDKDSYTGFHYSADDVAVVRMSLAGGTVRNHTLPNVASDTFALIAATQTLTNKTLTSPTINTSIVAGTATMADLNTVATTINAWGAATTITVGAAASAATWTGQSVTITGANTTNNTTLTVTNSTNTAVAAHSIVDITVGGITSTGDPQLRLTIPSGTSWYMGVDNDASDALRIGTGTAVGTNTFLHVSTGGSIVVGQTSTVSIGLTPAWTIGGTDASGGALLVASFGSNPSLRFMRSAAATWAGSGLVTNGTSLGSIVWHADDGTDYVTDGASISALVDGVPGVNDMPTRLVFATTADGANSATERLILDSAGALKPVTNDGVPLGTATLGFADLFLALGAVINFQNGNMTITHSAATLTIGGGTLALGANNLTMTGTISATGARVTQSYHTNITSTNAVTVDSSILSKAPESIRDYIDALAVIDGIRVVENRHREELDASGRLKLSVIAESIREPLLLREIEAPWGGSYPGVDMMGLLALNTRGIQQLHGEIAALRVKVAALA